MQNRPQDLSKIFETDEGEQDVIFLFEGSVPFVRVFVERHFNETPVLAKQIPNYQKVVSNIVTTFLDFLERMYEVKKGWF